MDVRSLLDEERRRDGQERFGLARYLDEVDVPAGRTFIREGEPGDRFYAIVDGEVRVTAGRVGDREARPGG